MSVSTNPTAEADARTVTTLSSQRPVPSETPKDNGAGQSKQVSESPEPPKLVRLRLTPVEVFRRDDVSRLIAKIQTILGKPEEGHGNVGPSSLTTYAWRVENRDAFFSLLSKPTNFRLTNVTPEVLDVAVSSISLAVWDTEALPFAILTVNATLDPKHWEKSKPEELGARLLPISHALRLFVQSLGGLIASTTSMSPNTPCVTWAGVAVSHQDIQRLTQAIQSNVGNPLVWEERDTTFFSQIPKNPPTGFPLRLEYDYRIIQSRSFIQFTGNVVELFGLSNQLGFGGRLTPYCICVGSDQSLFANLPDQILDYRLLALPSPFPDFLWGASALVTVVALNGWLRAVGVDIAGVESEAARWRRSVSTPDTQVDPQRILQIGSRTAHLASDLGVVSRLFTDALGIWATGVFERQREIPPSRQGVLGGLANETLDLLTNQTARLTGIRDEVSLLAHYTSDQTAIDANRTMRNLTAEIATHSRRSLWLTAVLVVLTSVLAILTYFLIVK